ncbi:hypothetical protein ACFL0U_02085 [Pseudomonadota bacterium]
MQNMKKLCKCEGDGIEIKKKLKPPKIIPMSLNVMCDKIKGRKLLGNNDFFYSNLSTLKSLRNRIHLDETKTDWFTFTNKEFLIMKSFLYDLLNSKFFNPNENERELFNFLESRRKLKRIQNRENDDVLL